MVSFAELCVKYESECLLGGREALKRGGGGKSRRGRVAAGHDGLLSLSAGPSFPFHLRPPQFPITCWRITYALGGKLELWLQRHTRVSAYENSPHVGLTLDVCHLPLSPITPPTGIYMIY